MHLQLKNLFVNMYKKYVSMGKYANSCIYIKIDVDVCMSVCLCEASKPAMSEHILSATRIILYLKVCVCTHVHALTQCQ